ncbi:MAG: kynureninase, partial [Flavobacteriales bacterium]|nr:kynureninase [Flavobacteriales bacterium]
MQGKFEHNLDWAKRRDELDEIGHYRQQYYHPTIHGKQAIYFTGNSLGLQPKGVKEVIDQELSDWALWGVEGHFHAIRPWYSYHELFTEKAAKIVGAKPVEVVMMNGLTVNLHMLLTSFYR